MLNNFWNYIVEFIGTLIFMYVIIANGEAIPIGLTLAVAIYFGGKISGGAFNPAASTMFYYQDKIDFTQFCGYIVVQLVAALCAYYFYSNYSYLYS